MSLKESLSIMLKEINEKIRKDNVLQSIQDQYKGRKFILNIDNEEYYKFNITPEDIILESMKELELKPTDMYIKIDRERAIKFIKLKRLRLGDLRFIEHKNITVKELKLYKKLQLM
ncbi:MAG: hypothetical protein ACFFDF_10380 [Candidatus Odinarchaeota archaeon]